MTTYRNRMLLTLCSVPLMGLMACQPRSVVTGGTVGGGTRTDGTATTTVVAASTTDPTTPSTSTSTTIAGSGTADTWRLVGGDEFNGTAVDGTRWKAYNNTYGDGNHELACLTPGNVSVSGGSLKIQARRETATCPGGAVRNYTSGFLGSREVGRYYPQKARFEIRAKLPHAQGLWPAFWLRHRDGASTAEVDILEYFHALRPGKTTSTLHLDGRHNLSQRHIAFEPSGPVSGWHTWGVEIADDPTGVRFTFTLDGVGYHSYVDTQHHWSSADPAATWDMAINMAVGGSWTGEPDGALGYLPDLGRCSLGGTAPSGCTATGIRRADWADPAATTYSVDWVRVFTH
jgi:beta-glucanase (GH16 family)